MPSYFGHEMNEGELSLQVLADDLALEYVRKPERRSEIEQVINESGMRRDMWEDTLARARRYIDG